MTVNVSVDLVDTNARTITLTYEGFTRTYPLPIGDDGGIPPVATLRALLAQQMYGDWLDRRRQTAVDPADLLALKTAVEGNVYDLETELDRIRAQQTALPLLQEVDI